MDNYTSNTKESLEERFRMSKDGVYYAHQPIYGYRTSKGSTSCIARYMVTMSILNALNWYSFKTFADIGGAEGYTSCLSPMKNLIGFFVGKLLNMLLIIKRQSMNYYASLRTFW